MRFCFKFLRASLTFSVFYNGYLVNILSSPKAFLGLCLESEFREAFE